MFSIVDDSFIAVLYLFSSKSVSPTCCMLWVRVAKVRGSISASASFPPVLVQWRSRRSAALVGNWLFRRSCFGRCSRILDCQYGVVRSFWDSIFRFVLPVYFVVASSFVVILVDYIPGHNLCAVLVLVGHFHHDARFCRPIFPHGLLDNFPAVRVLYTFPSRRVCYFAVGLKFVPASLRSFCAAYVVRIVVHFPLVHGTLR